MVYSRSLTHGLCTALQHLKADGLSLFLLSTALSQAVLAVLSGFSFANGSLLAPSRILERICIPRDVCRSELQLCR